MFKNYPRYRMGSEKYNGYLTDLFTARYYDNQVPFEDDLMKEAAYGARLWKADTEMGPEDLLYAAVIGSAVLEYLDVYDYGSGRQKGTWQDRKMTELEEFFSGDEMSQKIFNELTYLINTSWSLTRLKSEIKRSYSRFLAGIGRKKKGEQA